MRNVAWLGVLLATFGCSGGDGGDATGSGAGTGGQGGGASGTGGGGAGASAGASAKGGASGKAGTSGAGGGNAGTGGSGAAGNGVGGSAGTSVGGTGGSGGANAGAGGSGGGGGSGGASGTGGASAGTSSGAGAGGKAPTLFFDFVKGDTTSFYAQQPYGSVTFGTSDPGAHDQNAVALLWKANTDQVGPGGKATEIGTLQTLGFGEYRFRTKLATCKPDEELVNGHFVYQNDGGDHDGNGLVDNDEIDIEILCGQPTFFNLTSWTDYTDDTHMRKKSRIIDLETGTIIVGANDGYGADTSDPLNGTVDPALKHPGFYDPNAYYEMGWVWQKDSLRFFVVLGGQEVTLWTFTDATRIPQQKAAMLFNLWHPADHWNEDGTPKPATADATLSIDWFSYTALP